MTHVDDGFVFLGHRIIRKRGSLGNKRIVTTIPKDKFKHVAAKFVNELSSNYSENKIDLIVRLNRKLSGWANFYQFTDYTAVMQPLILRNLRLAIAMVFTLSGALPLL